MKRKFTLLAVCLTVGFGLFLGLNITDNSPTGSRTNSIEVGSKTTPTPVYDNSVIKYQDDMDGANDTTALKSRGYKIFRANPIGTTAAWFQGNDAVFPAFNGPTTGYTAANYNAVTGANNIDTWLILPKVNTNAGDSLSFVSRAPLASTFPDSIRVMYSATGDSTPAGSWVELGRFKVNTAGIWELRSYVAPAPGANARFAIRYAVVNGGPSGSNSDFIGIDAVTIHGPAGGGGNPPNASLLLPGVNTNYVGIPHQASMVGFGNDITIESWVRIQSTTSPNTVLNKGGSSFDYQLGINSTTANPFFRAQGTIVIGNTISIVPNVWTHLAVTVGGGTVKFYVNGVEMFSTASSPVLGSSTNEMRIGRGGNDPGQGNLDELRLWSVARSGPDILADMCKKWPGTFSNTTGLKAVWHMDSTYTDSVSGYNGTPTSGSVGFDVPAPCLITSVSQIGSEIPERYVLSQNYPNPFNPTTTIRFEIPKQSLVTLRVYDITGREVGYLINEVKNAGVYMVGFNGNNLASGTYFYRIQAGDFVEVKKMVLLK